ncbi:MAG: RluA family pseudouridine synthase [Candidatus Gastranaerophilales bacterium]|nr:RluA family pseudouridine synthase [Candidatus Gastranaerophilales bacterium]
MQTVTIRRNQAGQRLDKFLHRYLPQAGSNFLYKMLRKKNITLNGKKAEGKELLAEGDVVTCFFSDETYAKFSGTTGQNTDSPSLAASRDAYRQIKGVTILYEDADILILNKPVGVLCQKAQKDDQALNQWLTGYLLEQAEATGADPADFNSGLCNRLDRNTSGIVLCGKTLPGTQLLNQISKEQRIRKFYRTICVGELAEDMLLKGFWTKDEANNQVTISPKALPDGQPVQTGVHVLKTARGFSLLEVKLFTGKTHQIRAHLASIHHPVIGDRKYGDQTINKRFQKELGLNHQLLHAYRVEFPEELFLQMHPASVTAPCTELFQKVEACIFC